MFWDEHYVSSVCSTKAQKARVKADEAWKFMKKKTYKIWTGNWLLFRLKPPGCYKSRCERLELDEESLLLGHEVRWLSGSVLHQQPRNGVSVQTLVWRQLCEDPGAAAPLGDERSSSLDSFCSSLCSPRLMWLCRAAGVSHSLGRQLCRKGMQELK